MFVLDAEAECLFAPLGVLFQAQGRAKLGVEAFAEALLGFVKILAENSG
jgi:chaperonin GroEL (HSP60 family)